MGNPVVATVTRAGRPESVHRGFGVVADVRGRTVARFGEEETPIYWRSAAKPFQVLPLLEAGGEKAFGLSASEIALACASHRGEPRHVEAVRGMLDRGGFTESDLRCGAHPPYDEASASALAASGRPASALHNNCSGKHAAMLLACRLCGFQSSSYDDPEHPLQRRIRKKISFYSMYPEEKIEIGIDGCSLPVFRLPASRLATAYARLLARELPDEGPAEAAARRRAAEAMAGQPFFVSGTGQFTTLFIEEGAGRRIGKEGAEGVYAVALDSGFPRGIAVKIEDGAARARNAVTMDLMVKLGEFPAGVPEALRPFRRPAVRNVRGLPVGEIVADVPLERVATEAAAVP